MTNFDDLPLKEKIKTFNEIGVKLAEAVKPVVERLAKVFRDFGRAVSLAVGEISAEDFERMYMLEAKKERRRKRYYRMMARRK
jgi:hypothetical protein